MVFSREKPIKKVATIISPSILIPLQLVPLRIRKGIFKNGAQTTEELKYFTPYRISTIKVNLANLDEADPNDTFSIATTSRCKGGYYYIPWIAALYP